MKNVVKCTKRDNARIEWHMEEKTNGTRFWYLEFNGQMHNTPWIEARRNNRGITLHSWVIAGNCVKVTLKPEFFIMS